MKLQFKKRYLLISIILLCLIAVFYFYTKLDTVTIHIKNNTSQSLTGLTVNYTGSSSEYSIPTIPANSSCTKQLTLPADFDEGQIEMIAYGRNYTILGYLERGTFHRLTVNINTIDKNKKLTLKVKTSFLSSCFHI
ncbi:hypothetical protein [Velocimicrobium porci]|uniref:Uncharacterized protein n=1 Tax=Velocimicrobium porci TaxID=2606634 RepID=A0A6L5XVH6_9FIRM|nr:hypothetical protein [Velocimicrobium porci]MSS62752.1 hypothetical protein [Velocimicrobium porci]